MTKYKKPDPPLKPGDKVEAIINIYSGIRINKGCPLTVIGEPNGFDDVLVRYENRHISLTERVYTPYLKRRTPK